MDGGNKKWWTLPRWSDEYENELDKYLERTFSIEGEGREMRCPCKKCCYRCWFQPHVAKDHVISKGFLPMPEMNSNSCINDRMAEADDVNRDVEVDNGCNGRLRLHGRGVTKRKHVKKGNERGKGYILPSELLDSLVKQIAPELLDSLVKQIAPDILDSLKQMVPDLTSSIISQIQAANPGIQLTIPNFDATSGDTSSVGSCQANGQTSSGQGTQGISNQPTNEDNA